jgi:uridine kinase
MFLELLNLIKETRAQVQESRPLVVGIEGRSGAGKSTLAHRIQESLGDVTVIHKDDFYSALPEIVLAELNPAEGYGRYFEWERLIEQVLLPLSSGTAASYQRFDWSRKVPGAWISIAASSRFLIVEGVYSLRPELRGYCDIKVLVDADEEIRASRLAARGENSQAWIRRWSAAEEYYFKNIFAKDGVFLIRGQTA